LRPGSFGAAVLAAAVVALSVARAQENPVSPVPTPPAPAPGATAPGGATAAPTETIVGVRVVGYQTVSPEAIEHYLQIKVGDPYDPEKIRSNFSALWDAGLLENVRIEAEHSAAGVTLIVTIEERPIVKEVVFTGNKKLSTSQIRDRLKEAKIEVRPGAPLSLRDVARARASIADFYQEQGFRSATVSYHIDDISKTEKKVVFEIDEGEKLKIESITFTGNEHISAQSLRNAMHKTKVAVWWRLLSDNTVYSQANYEADAENIKALYQAKGFKNAVVKDPILDVYVTNPKAKPTKIKRRVRITIPIVEGDRFYTNEIDITRVGPNGQPADPPDPTVYQKAVLLKQFRDLPPGSILNHDYLVEGLQAIEAMYKSRGYIYWFADPVYTEIGDLKVNVDIKIFEGDKFYLGRLEVQGNTDTRDKVIRREFALDEGDVLDMEAIKKSVTKIQQLGYFKMTEEPGFSVRPEEKKVDITIKGQETSRNEIQFGAGYSGFDGFFGQFSFQTRNFLGRGEIIGVSAQLGKVSNYYDLSYSVPWFMDRNQSVGVSLYRRNVNYASIEQRTTGGSLYYGKGLGLFDSVSALYAYDDILANFPVQSAPNPPGQPPPPQKFTETTGTTSSITPGYNYDSRNDPFNPTRGFHFYATLQVAPELLGGNSAFIKPILGATYYLPVRLPRNGLIGLNFNVGWIKPLSGSQIQVYQRFQLGGEQSLRGFRQGQVVPLKDNNQVFTDDLGRILGGDKFFILNVEYQFLQIGPATLLAFLDVGNNYFETQNISFSNLRSSAGAELRIFLPIFQAPLRFIYSFNLHPVNPINQYGFPIPSLEERPSGFDFSIGRTF
jgi:outer membrane protein insertion porin family